jgi:hypothetical protein
MASNLRKTGPVIALGIVVAAILAGALWRHSAMRSSENVPSVALEDGESGAQQHRPPTASQAVAPPRQFSQADRLRLNAERKQKRKDMVERARASNAALIARHRAEKVDPQWAAATETRLQEVAKMSGFEEAVTPTSLDIDCRATTCKIDAGLASRSLGEDWAMLYMSSVGSNVKRAFTSVVTEPDGTSRVVIYAIAR